MSFLCGFNPKHARKTIKKFFHKGNDTRSKLIHDDAIWYKNFVACEVWKK